MTEQGLYLYGQASGRASTPSVFRSDVAQFVTICGGSTLHSACGFKLCTVVWDTWVYGVYVIVHVCTVRIAMLQSNCKWCPSRNGMSAAQEPTT